MIDLNSSMTFFLSSACSTSCELWCRFDAMSIHDSESTGCFGPKKKKDSAKGSQKGKPDVAYQK